MKRFLSGVVPPMTVFALSTAIGFWLYFENLGARAVSSPVFTLSDQSVAHDDRGISDLTMDDTPASHLPASGASVSDLQARVNQLRDLIASAQLLANPDLAALRRGQLAELERQRQEWEDNLQAMLVDSYQGVMAEFSDQHVETQNDYFFDHLALEPLKQNQLLAALNKTEREKRRLDEDLRLGRLTQAQYSAALAKIRLDDDIWRDMLGETQFIRYQELRAARTRQSYLATAINHVANHTGPMSDQGRELLITAYAGLLEKQSAFDSSTSNPAQIYEARLVDYTDMAEWLAPQLGGYDLVALETFLGYRGLEMEERFLEQLRSQPPTVVP